MDKRSRPLACLKLMRQYFTVLLNFSSIRFIKYNPFFKFYNEYQVKMSPLIRVNPTITAGGIQQNCQQLRRFLLFILFQLCLCFYDRSVVFLCYHLHCFQGVNVTVSESGNCLSPSSNLFATSTANCIGTSASQPRSSTT
jgi:hypothetical protein